MKILITGSTANQASRNHWLRMQLKIIPSTTSLYDCLKDMGHEVVQRPTIIGEDLSNYDESIIYFASPGNISAGYLYNALYALSQRPKSIIAFDDWQVQYIYDGLMKLKDNLFHDYAVKNWIGANHEDADVIPPLTLVEYKNCFEVALAILTGKVNRVLYSSFAGGDLTKMIRFWDEKFIHRYNPNPYHFQRQPGQFFHPHEKSISILEDSAFLPENKQKVFNFSSLVQSATNGWLSKQGIYKWPIVYYGNKAKEQVRLVEGQMVQTYANQWGCLMPAYYNSGSGWWRSKPLQLAQCGSILVGDFDELMILYKDDSLATLKASDIEQLSDSELPYIAQCQKEALLSSHPLDKSVQRNELSAVLEK